MIKANHSPWFEKLFRWYIFRLYRKHFAGMYLFGKMPATNPRIPIILVPNHATWWDGFFVYLLNVIIFQRQFYLMMTEQQLRSFPFFTKVGAYSVPEKMSKDVVKSLEYTLGILKEPKTPAPLICIFPQGELVSWFKRPLEFKRGLEWILNRYPGEVDILPLGIKTEFGEEQRPDVFFLLGDNYTVHGPDFPGMQWLESGEEKLLDSLSDLIAKRAESTQLLTGKISIHHRYRQLRQRVFGRE